jgi:hypothetical protein
MKRLRMLMPLVMLAGFAALGDWLWRRQPARFEPVVECSQGHHYRSIWVPGGSLKALRWFGRRYQWCPVGRHWSWTRRVDADLLAPSDLQAANAVHDLRVA